MDQKPEAAGTGGLSANRLKAIAMISMLIDHLTWAFIPPWKVSAIVLHTIGRMTIPIMCFFIAEGYYRTKNLKRYCLRLAIFALISHFPFNWFQNRSFSLFPTGVIFSLLCGLLALWIWDKAQGRILKVLGIVVMVLLTRFSDWPFAAPLFVLAFGIFRDGFYRQAAAFSLVFLAVFGFYIYLYRGYMPCILPLCGLLLPLPLLSRYSGERGRGGRAAKWGFYIFYPLHLLAIDLLLGLLS